MNILVTGSRAPSSTDIMRSLIEQGYSVYSADSMPFPLGRFVKGIKKHITLPKPNRDLACFLNALKQTLIEYKIDVLIPTCEEIFYISQGYDELSKHTRLFSEPFSRLNPLHNKYEFIQLAASFGLDVPQTWLLTTESDKAKVTKDLPIVLKPIYSRFASQVIIKPEQDVLETLPLSMPYLAQEFIAGKEYCAYAIAHQGQVLTHSCYHPKYTAGLGAGIYFEPASLPVITQFLIDFCNQYQFSGQIAFDFIVRGEKAYVLECNPRATSGFHLIKDHIHWQDIFNGVVQKEVSDSKPYMLGIGMLIHGLKPLRDNSTQFIKDYRSAIDVLKPKDDAWFGVKSMVSTGNLICRMIAERKNLNQVSTDDIEFNGK